MNPTVRFVCMRSPDHENDALTELGRKQVAAVIDEHLRGFRFTRMYYSDNARSKQLAELIGDKLGSRHSDIRQEPFFGYRWAADMLKTRHSNLIHPEDETGVFIRIHKKEHRSAMNWLQFDAQSQLVMGRFTGMMLEIADQLIMRGEEHAEVFIATHRGCGEMPALILDQEFQLLRPADAAVYTITPRKPEGLHIAAIDLLKNPLSKK